MSASCLRNIQEQLEQCKDTCNNLYHVELNLIINNWEHLNNEFGAIKLFYSLSFLAVKLENYRKNVRISNIQSKICILK